MDDLMMNRVVAHPVRSPAGALLATAALLPFELGQPRFERRELLAGARKQLRCIKATRWAVAV